MKKLTTTMMQRTLNKQDGRLTIGSSCYCVLDEAGDVLMEQRLSTTPKAIQEIFGAMPRSRIALETGTHSPWVSRLLKELGHEAIVAHARSVRLIGESRRKDDRLDARTLARLVRIDPELLCPVKHRSAEAQADLTVIRARAALVRTRTMLVNAARGLTKSYGERLRGCNARGMKPKAAQDLSPELKSALEPLMREVESVSERICEYDQMLESMARNRHPEAERLKQIKGVGTLIALTYMLTLEHIHRIVSPHKNAVIPIFSGARDHLLVSLGHEDGQNQRSRVTVGSMAAWVGGVIDKVHDRPAVVYPVIGEHVEIIGSNDR
jgi:hypothetical protein